MSRQQQRVSVTNTRIRKINPNHKQDMDWLKLLRIDCRNKSKADPNWGFTVNAIPRLGKDSPHLQDYLDGKYAPRTRYNVLPEHASWFDVYVIQYAKRFSRQTAFDNANGIERNPTTDFHSLYMLGDKECERLVGLFSLGRKKYFEKMRAAGLFYTEEPSSVNSTSSPSPSALTTLITNHLNDYNRQNESNESTNVKTSFLQYDLNIRDEKEMSFVHFLAQNGTWFVTQHKEGCIITNEPLPGKQIFDGYVLGSFTNVNGQFASKLFSNGTWKIERKDTSFVVTPITGE